MRKKLAKLPSPAMAVAFVALLAALTGTAVALPGSNSVTSGDIKRGAVGTSDIKNNSVSTTDLRNSSIRGRDVRNNTLTGSDISEGSLGSVPFATRAGTANAAGIANAAGVAGSVTNMRMTGQGRLAYDAPDQVLLSTGAYTISLRCDSTDGTQIVIDNVGGGNDSMTYAYMDGSNNHNDDFDQGEEEFVTDTTTGQDYDEGTLMVEGSAGRSIHVFASTATPEGDDSWPDSVDCVGSAWVTFN